MKLIEEVIELLDRWDAQAEETSRVEEHTPVLEPAESFREPFIPEGQPQQGVPDTVCWSSVLEQLRHRLGHQDVEIWFHEAQPEKHGDALVLRFPNAYYADFVLDNYMDVLGELAGCQVGVVANQPVDIEEPKAPKRPVPSCWERAAAGDRTLLMNLLKVLRRRRFGTMRRRQLEEAVQKAIGMRGTAPSVES